MGKRFGIIAAACSAFMLCFALVGCGGVDKGAYMGTWELESGSDENLSEDSVGLLKDLGLDVTLTLNEDDKGVLDLFGESMNLTWSATSSTEGTVNFDGNDAMLKLGDGKLTLEDATGSTLTFVPSTAKTSASVEPTGSEAPVGDSAASGEAAASGDSASSEAAAVDDASASADAADEESEGAAE